jgi:hypothetical protein
MHVPASAKNCQEVAKHCCKAGSKARRNIWCCTAAALVGGCATQLNRSWASQQREGLHWTCACLRVLAWGVKAALSRACATQYSH